MAAETRGILQRGLQEVNTKTAKIKTVSFLNFKRLGEGSAYMFSKAG